MVEAAGYTVSYHVHDHDDGFAMTGLEMAQALGENPDRVFKTLVTQGKVRRALRFHDSGRLRT